MSETKEQVKHTPGPWHVGAMSGDVFAIPTKQRSPIPVCCEPEEGSPNWEADARLIAAAPELLKSLRGLVREISQHFPIITEPVETEIGAEYDGAIAAIAKAEGR